MPVLCRLNQMSAIDNNKKQVVIFGHPGLVQVPNQVSAKVCLHYLSSFPSDFVTETYPHDMTAVCFMVFFKYLFSGFVSVIEAFDALY